MDIFKTYDNTHFLCFSWAVPFCSPPTLLICQIRSTHRSADPQATCSELSVPTGDQLHFSSTFSAPCRAPKKLCWHRVVPSARNGRTSQVKTCASMPLESNAVPSVLRESPVRVSVWPSSVRSHSESLRKSQRLGRRTYKYLCAYDVTTIKVVERWRDVKVVVP